MANGNDERVVQHLDEVLEVSQKSVVHYYDGLSLIKITNAYSRLQKEEENMKWALASYDFASKVKFSELRVLAADALFQCVRSTLAAGRRSKFPALWRRGSATRDRP
ncbi:MAG: hypothetical protein WDN75_18705 [Bacteroidota bacterium]